MVQLSATKCSCIAILWVSLVSFDAITLCVVSQRVLMLLFISLSTYSGNFWIYPRTFVFEQWTVIPTMNNDIMTAGRLTWVTSKEITSLRSILYHSSVYARLRHLNMSTEITNYFNSTVLWISSSEQQQRKLGKTMRRKTLISELFSCYDFRRELCGTLRLRAFLKVLRKFLEQTFVLKSEVILKLMGKQLIEFAQLKIRRGSTKYRRGTETGDC
jgi:hypothetical protein